ncbi:hypothetical protein P280DRAFT_547994 [Massarina eburnea CBS 473.64]|uniref:Uncharacterized protein n=1 Tax=Massarina eburnea CBS 473.64 TaxID=1395130 RepID=A0A6A6S708_9PLEO|nr:hypothetical protein P280DRAFT_547994 [Massarina eburnea CBS 473.64]
MECNCNALTQHFGSLTALEILSKFFSSTQWDKQMIKNYILHHRMSYLGNDYMLSPSFTIDKVFAAEPPTCRYAWAERNLSRFKLHFASIQELRGFQTNNAEYFHFARKISVDEPKHGAEFSALAKFLQTHTLIQELEIGVDELQMDVSLTLNRVVLRRKGMDKLREVYVPQVKFTRLMHGSLGPKRILAVCSGPIPGGVLETIVAKDMMTPSSEKLPQSSKPTSRVLPTPNFPEKDISHPASRTPPMAKFLEKLHPELRNMVYTELFTSEGGVIVPSPLPPTSTYVNGSRGKKSAPHSVLALLETNKQIFEEAVGLYYSQNRFVFYYVSQMIAFLKHLTKQRQNYLFHITLWHTNLDIQTFPESIPYLLALPQLKNLDLFIRNDVAFRAGEGQYQGLAGENGLAELVSRGVKLTIKCDSASRSIWTRDRIIESLPPGITTTERFWDNYPGYTSTMKRVEGCRRIENWISILAKELTT